MQLHRSVLPKVDVMPNNIITFQMFSDRSITAVIFIKNSTRPRRTRILNSALLSAVRSIPAVLPMENFTRPRGTRIYILHHLLQLM